MRRSVCCELEVQTSNKAAIEVTGAGLFESGDAELRLNVTALAQSLLDKIEQDPEVQAAGQPFNVELQHVLAGTTRLRMSFAASVDGGVPSFNAAIDDGQAVESALVVNQGNAQFIAIPMTSLAPGQYIVTISDEDQCVTGEFVVDVPIVSTASFEEIVAIFDGESTFVSGHRRDTANEVSVEVGVGNGFPQAIVVPAGVAKLAVPNVPAAPGDVVRVKVIDGQTVDIVVDAGHRSLCDSTPNFSVRRYVSVL